MNALIGSGTSCCRKSSAMGESVRVLAPGARADDADLALLLLRHMLAKPGNPILRTRKDAALRVPSKHIHRY
jgi:hypothetical protein